jgi:hypothetical protein
MIPVVICPYCDDDFPAVCLLEESGEHESYRSAVFVRQTSEIYADTFLVATLNNEIVGYTVGTCV